MVKRVFGKVDGTSVIFECKQGDIWQVPVPLDEDGEYIVEIIAEDEAGNRSYVTKLLLCKTPTGIIAKIISGFYFGQVLPKIYSCHAMCGKPYFIEENMTFTRKAYWIEEVTVCRESSLI